MAHVRNYVQRTKKKRVHSISLASTGNALKWDRNAHICTADSIRLNVKRSRSGSDCLPAAP